MHFVLKFWLWGRFVAEKQTYVLNLMAGHLLNMTYNENGKLNVWELDHYADRSSLGIHFWDLCWKMVYLKFENFWYSNVRPWETVQIWGDCPPCSPSRRQSDTKTCCVPSTSPQCMQRRSVLGTAGRRRTATGCAKSTSWSGSLLPRWERSTQSSDLDKIDILL